jgi:hypothetical protein
LAASAQIAKVNWWHERLADKMISEPHLTLTEIAKQLSCSLSWLSIIKQSDVFKDYWALRSKAHSEALTAGIKEKAAALTELSLDILLEDTQSQIALGTMSTREARENLELVTKRFGFDGGNGPQSAQNTNVTLNLALVNKEMLAAAREKMREIPQVVEPLPLAKPKEEVK